MTQIGKRRFTETQLKAIHHKPLDLIADNEGSITLGWVDAGVYYARFNGVLSAELSARHTARLESALERVQVLDYFSDGRALRTYDLAARRAFLDIVRAHRSQFRSIVMLTWSQGLTPAADSLVSALGRGAEVLADEDEFEAKLLAVAPLARGKLDPNGWMRGASRARR